jgi:hypothetical protein
VLEVSHLVNQLECQRLLAGEDPAVRDGPHLGVPLFEGGSPLLPQGSLAPVRVLLSRSISAYYDPIRQSRGHIATSPLGGLYAMPSLCGSA